MAERETPRCTTWASSCHRVEAQLNSPRRRAEGQKPLQLDSGPPKIPLSDYTRNETRFRMVERQDPARWKQLLAAAEEDVRLRWDLYAWMAGFAEEGGLASRRVVEAASAGEATADRTAEQGRER